ncbi:dipeptidase [Mucilaginibacter jinjuensis]|uniref:Membrane dipeptidase n=1 Tax=Mucilaginibacter jinjuensis TaxID=1176721 RepID=A0ABY7T9V9_9SPHI|nr:membrane dipeptidase [Mucilaginibacter jinjuensis]WCT11992.1 membrane dipeptidase [Mucilaginibacter jinjuensis]
MKFQENWSRRKFLAALAIGGAGSAILMDPLAAWALVDIDPRVAKIVADTIGIDTHNHIDVPLTAGDIPGPNIDLAGEMKKSGLSAICMTFALDYQKMQNPGDAYEKFKNGFAAIDLQLKNNGMKRSINLADLREAHKKHQPTVIQSIEGAHFLEGHLERVSEAYDKGLRHLGLLHDSDASVPLGDVYTNPAVFGGLTAFGADVVKECNRLGILIDLAHANQQTVAAALKITKHPVLISHTGLDTQLGQNPNMARMMKPRLISKEQAKIVADVGGVIGVWTHLSDTPLEYAQNVRALVDVVGIDHVCIGTDTKLTPSYRPAGAGGFGGPPPGGGQDKGPGGPSPGNGPVRPRVGERTNEAWADQKAGFYYAVVDAMLKTGFNADEIGKFGGGNFCRVFDAATAGH